MIDFFEPRVRRMSDAVLEEHRLENAGGRLWPEPEVRGQSIQESALGSFHLPVGQYEIGRHGEGRRPEAAW